MKNDKFFVLAIYVAKGVLQFIPLLVFGHLIDQSEAASFIIGISIFGLLVPLFDYGYRIYVFRFFTRSDDFQRNDAQTGMVIKVGLLGLSLVINFSIGTWDTSVSYLPYIFAAFLASIANHLYFFMGATDSFAKEAQGVGIYAAVLCAATFWVWWFERDFSYTFLIASIGYVIAAALHFRAQSKPGSSERAQTHLGQFYVLMPYSIHVYVSVGIGLGDNLFLSLFSDQTVVIQYSVFLRIFLITNFLTSPFVQVITPQISLAVKQGNFLFLRMRLFYDLRIAAVFALVMTALYPLIVLMLFPEYTDSIGGTSFALLFGALAFARFASLSGSVIVSMMGNQWSRVYTLGFFTFTGYGLYYMLSAASVTTYSLILLYMVAGTSIVYSQIAYLSIRNK